jgi:hypothetical protein
MGPTKAGPTKPGPTKPGPAKPEQTTVKEYAELGKSGIAPGILT